jgi:membrane fusion protein, multidrug efflux system
MNKKIIKNIVLIFGFLGLFSGSFFYFRKPKLNFAVQTPVAVQYYKVRKGEINQKESFVGKVRTFESVALSSEVSGRIVSMKKDGSKVKKGEVIVQLNDKEAYGRLVSAKGSKKKEESKLESIKKLFDSGFRSLNHLRESEADFEREKGRSIEAESNFEKHKITAPFDGVIGLQKQSIGAVVNPNTKLVNVTNLENLQVEFSIPENILYKNGGINKIKEAQILITVEGDLIPIEAYFSASETVIDQETNGVLVRVLIPGLSQLDKTISPGQFANVNIDVGKKEGVLVVPNSAIQNIQGANLVYKIVDGIAVQMPVKVGVQDESKSEILEGLSQDDYVIASGQYKITDGQPVVEEK